MQGALLASDDTASTEGTPEDRAERESILRMRRGDIDGLGYLVEKYELRAVRIATMITCDPALEKDVVQEAFVRAYERIHQFDVGKAFGPWFLRSISNASLRAVRDRKRTSPLEDTVGRLEGFRGGSLVPSPKTPEDLIESAETNQEVWQALASLPAKQRHTLVLRYVYGLSEKELSDALACSTGTIKWRLIAARQKLKGLLALKKEGISGEGRNEEHN